MKARVGFVFFSFLPFLFLPFQSVRFTLSVKMQILPFPQTLVFETENFFDKKFYTVAIFCFNVEQTWPILYLFFYKVQTQRLMKLDW